MATVIGCAQKHPAVTHVESQRIPKRRRRRRRKKRRWKYVIYNECENRILVLFASSPVFYLSFPSPGFIFLLLLASSLHGNAFRKSPNE